MLALMLGSFLSISYFFLAAKELPHENDFEKLNHSKKQIIPWGQKLVGVNYYSREESKHINS